MKRMMLAMSLLVGAPALAHASSYEIDPVHTTTGFSVKHMMVATVHGRFEKVSGTVSIDDANPANDKINVDIDATSITTDNEKRDGHLKSPDFFDVAKFPKITFVSKSAKAAGAGAVDVTGDLTMHGVTKPVTLHVTDISPNVASPMDKKNHRGASATATLNRQDFGVKWNAPTSGKAGDVVVSDEVKIQIDAELVEKK
ncbi:MAG: polyisoprenoid-binding protein [Deltaproteobacteria bacterium]|nr:polyisoprenoid-binding protein [Deltaproteobacteria bacterium]